MFDTLVKCLYNYRMAKTTKRLNAILSYIIDSRGQGLETSQLTLINKGNACLSIRGFFAFSVVAE